MAALPELRSCRVTDEDVQDSQMKKLKFERNAHIAVPTFWQYLEKILRLPEPTYFWANEFYRQVK